MPKRFSLYFYLISCFAILATAFWYPKWEKPATEATLSWDVMGYYLYLPAAFIHNDIATLNFKEEIINKYHPTSSFYQATKLDNGQYVMKYPIGLAILYAPFFLLGHLYALISHYPPDGFSLPYQMAISFGSIFIAFLGLWYLRKILNQFFNDKITGVALVLIAIATNYLNYTAIDGAMAHNWVFTLFTILIWQTIKWYQKPTFRGSLIIGACIGFSALSRPSDLLSFLIPVLWGISNTEDIRNRFIFFQNQWQKILLSIIVVALIGSIQLFYWKNVTGNWLHYSYNEYGFDWFHPHLKDVLISVEKGWLVYTPIMLLALLGLVPLYQKYRKLFWVNLVYFLINYYVVASWSVWGYGGSFGQRALIESYALLVFPLAAFLENIWQKDWQKWLTLIFAIFCIWLNVFQTYQAHGHGFETEAMTKAYYWRIFANPNPSHLDRKLLDTKEDFQGERNNIQVIYIDDFEKEIDTLHYSKIHSKSGEYALQIHPSREFTPAIIIKTEEKSPKWIRVSADFYAPQKEWDVWKMTQLIVRFEKGNQLIKNRKIRIQRHIEEKQWQTNWTDMQIPEEDFDHIKIYFWNSSGQKELYVDDLKVEVYEE